MLKFEKGLCYLTDFHRGRLVFILDVVSRLKEGNPSAAMPMRSNPLRESSQGRVTVKCNLKKRSRFLLNLRIPAVSFYL